MRLHRITLTCPLLLLVALGAVPLEAQAPPTGVQLKVTNGSCRVVLVMPADPAKPREVEIRVDNLVAARVTVPAGGNEAVATLNDRVTGTHEVTAVHAGQVFAATERSTLAAGAGHGCERPAVKAAADDRDGFSASFYIGAAVDNFAPSRLGNYVEDPTIPNKTRWITGIDFAYRLFGRDDGDVQFWLLGETLHGVRTADVDCSAAHAPTICQNDPVSLGEAGATLRYIIKNASSLEAFISPRLELFTFNRDSEVAAAKLYVSTRFGMIGLSDAPKSFAAHHFGVGLASMKGPFEGSALEIGKGCNDLFERPQGRGRYYRWKLDALLSVDVDLLPDLLTNVIGSPRPFIQFYLDNDIRGPGADSVQTFFGLDFRLGR